jgi:hypothetical protein
MKSRSPLGLLFASAILLSAFSTASAQEIYVAKDLTGEESVQAQKTPSMIIHDGPLPPPPAPKPENSKSPKSKHKATPDKTKSESEQPQENDSPKPIVIPAREVTHAAPGKMGTTGNPHYDELILKSATRHGVDPNLVIAVMRQESGFNSRARSYKGATGLMQLMPATARRFGVENIYDPAQNIEAGTRYLRFLLDTFDGDVELALAGYNAGENAVVRYGYQIPRYRETQNYVKSISAKYGKNKSGRSQVASASSEPVAPAAITFSNGGSSRLSNNY